MAAIRLRGLTKRYGNTVVVHPLDLEIPDGSFNVLVGPSGCGKTTTLRMIAGLAPATAGSVSIGERDVTNLDPKDRNVAMVFQNYALYPHLDVRRNIGFALEAHKLPRAQIRQKVDEVAELLGIEELLRRKPGALSGGQQQRVAIARAIVREPDVFLFDEPLSNLDAKLRVQTRTELLRLQRQLGATVIYVTHDQEEALTLADELIVMHDGRVLQQGPPSTIYRRPVNETIARFIGSPEINLIDGEVTAGRFRGADLEIDLPDAPDGPVRVGVRPDAIRRAESLPPERRAATLTAPIDVLEFLGSVATVHLDLGTRELRMVVSEDEADDLVEGKELAVALDARRVHVFDVTDGHRLS
jgi:multiple sugar transport system ATP-binding protein